MTDVPMATNAGDESPEDHRRRLDRERQSRRRRRVSRQAVPFRGDAPLDVREWLLNENLLPIEQFEDALGVGKAVLQVVRDAMAALPSKRH